MCFFVFAGKNSMRRLAHAKDAILEFYVPHLVQKHYLGEVEKQSIFWLRALFVTFLPKIMKIDSRMSKL